MILKILLSPELLGISSVTVGINLPNKIVAAFNEVKHTYL